jgi:predicted transcriptional regulator
MDFKTAAILGTYISKDYTEDFFKLLVNYHDVSASEAASRLGLHIQTAQDFLDAMASLGILEKVEVYEKKRPYFRYSLKTQRIQMDIDLTKIEKKRSAGDLDRYIREKAHAGANFVLSRDGKTISHVVVWSGIERDRKEHRINLTRSQGIFLYNLPFPNVEFLSIAEVMDKADLGRDLAPEILDIVELLSKYGVIEERQ